MKYTLLAFCLLVNIAAQGQKLNDSSFDTRVAHSKGKSPKVLFGKGLHNFIGEMGLTKPLMNVATADGYQVEIDSIKFNSKNQVTNEITFT